MRSKKIRANGNSLIFPVPHYGRGIELFLLMRENFPESRILIDTGIVYDLEKILCEPVWYKEEAYRKVCSMMEQLKKYAIDFG